MVFFFSSSVRAGIDVDFYGRSGRSDQVQFCLTFGFTTAVRFSRTLIKGGCFIFLRVRDKLADQDSFLTSLFFRFSSAEDFG